jgi:hypothetical protein
MTPLTNILQTESRRTARHRLAKKILLHKLHQIKLERRLIQDDYESIKPRVVELPKHERPKTDWTKSIKSVYHLMRVALNP